MTTNFKQVRIKQVRSIIRTTLRQRRTIESLGLRRIGHVKTVVGTEPIMGMIRTVSHLIEILPEENNK